jgi:hypothetical protein
MASCAGSDETAAGVIGLNPLSMRVMSMEFLMYFRAKKNAHMKSMGDEDVLIA